MVLNYELGAEPTEGLNGGRVLGLQLQVNNGELKFRRGNELPTITDTLTKRELFSVCGRLVVHFPLAGWLRVVSSIVKKMAQGGWETHVDGHVLQVTIEIVERVKMSDPVRSRRLVPMTTTAKVWCDAKSLAIGVVLEVHGAVV